ncbi:PE-PGRS family protein PE_PGRS30-like isoform X3 [Columba livia]|uniref:PE-PGRS family protein PE_PGRS30-like isoform X3 n=1 Tax=Columba livia TaxID=8932 RepID=UPI0031BBAC72
MRQGAGAAVSLVRMPKPRALIGPRCLGAGAGGGRPEANGNGGRGGCGALAAAGARASGGGRLRAALREVSRRRQKGGGEGGDSRGPPAAGVFGARRLSVPAEPGGTAGEREGNGAAKEAAGECGSGEGDRAVGTGGAGGAGAARRRSVPVPPPPPALTAALAKLLGGVRSGAASPSGAAPVPGAAAPPGAAQPPSVAGTVTSRAKARLRAGWVAWRAGRRSGGSSGRAPAGSVSCGRGFRAAALSVRFFVWSRLFFGFFLAGFPRNAARPLARGCRGGSQWRRPVGKARYCTRPPQRGAAARLGAAALWRNSGTAAPGKGGGQRRRSSRGGSRSGPCVPVSVPPDGGQVPICVKTTSLPRCLLKRLMT